MKKRERGNYRGREGENKRERDKLYTIRKRENRKEYRKIERQKKRKGHR